jgi:hypothetical protein
VATFDNESFGKAEVVLFAESALPALVLFVLLQATKQLIAINRINLYMTVIFVGYLREALQFQYHPHQWAISHQQFAKGHCQSGLVEGTFDFQ